MRSKFYFFCYRLLVWLTTRRNTPWLCTLKLTVGSVRLLTPPACAVAQQQPVSLPEDLLNDTVSCPAGNRRVTEASLPGARIRSLFIST